MATSYQDDYLKTALRLPRELHAKLMDAARASGRSLNAELIARLEASTQSIESRVYTSFGLEPKEAEDLPWLRQTGGHFAALLQRQQGEVEWMVDQMRHMMHFALTHEMTVTENRLAKAREVRRKLIDAIDRARVSGDRALEAKRATDLADIDAEIGRDETIIERTRATLARMHYTSPFGDPARLPTRAERGLDDPLPAAGVPPQSTGQRAPSQLPSRVEELDQELGSVLDRDGTGDDAGASAPNKPPPSKA